jgi:hypothetical protein
MSNIRRLVAVSITSSVVAAVVTAEFAVRSGRDFTAGLRYGASA